MSFYYAKITNLDVTTINGKLPDSITLANNSSNGRFYVPFYNSGTGSTNTLYTNSKVQLNPSTGVLYANSLIASAAAPMQIQTVSGGTLSILSDGLLTATAPSLKLAINSNTGNAGDVLTSDGTNASWVAPAIPAPIVGTMVANVYDSSSPSTQLGTVAMQFSLEGNVVTVITQGMVMSLTAFSFVSSFPVVNTGNVPTPFLPVGGYAFTTGNGTLYDGTFTYNIPLKIGFGSAGGIVFQANLADTNSGGWGNAGTAYPSIINGVYQYCINPY